MTKQLCKISGTRLNQYMQKNYNSGTTITSKIIKVHKKRHIRSYTKQQYRYTPNFIGG